MEVGEHTDRMIIKDARQDALKITKTYLELFRSQKRYVKNLEEDIEDSYTGTVKLVATYGEQIGHSSLKQLEGGARLAEDEGHQRQRKAYKQAKHLAERLERAIEDLPHTERVILQKRYINNTKTPWDAISGIVGYERRNCVYLHDKGLRSVATDLFGIADVLKAENAKKNRKFKL